MSDDDECLPHLVAEVKEKAMQLLFVLSVKAAAWLVGKDHIGLVDESPGYCNPLLLAAGKFAGLMRGSFGKPHERKEFFGPTLCLPP